MDYILSFFLRNGASQERWVTVDSDVLLERMGDAESKKKKLVKLATMIAWTPAVERSSVDKWVHDDGRVLILSDAAHVFFPCSIQNLAVAVCDATTLDHLFLNAFQEIRPERIRSMHTLELSNIDFSLMPNGPAQEARDESLKERRDKELNALDFVGSKEGDNKEEMDISMRL